MNVEIGTEAPIFLFWEYLFKIFGILSLQCSQLADSVMIDKVPLERSLGGPVDGVGIGIGGIDIGGGGGCGSDALRLYHTLLSFFKLVTFF
jgi:hypothetical protein